jgi:hypothetical protein
VNSFSDLVNSFQDTNIIVSVSTFASDGSLYSSFDLPTFFSMSNPATGGVESFKLYGVMYHLMLASGDLGSSSDGGGSSSSSAPKMHKIKFASEGPHLLV